MKYYLLFDEAHIFLYNESAKTEHLFSRLMKKYVSSEHCPSLHILKREIHNGTYHGELHVREICKSDFDLMLGQGIGEVYPELYL